MLLRHALRRLMWTVPTLLGVSLLAFLLLSLVPDPTDDPRVAGAMAPAELEAHRRERFLDRPRFVDVAPRDVRARAMAAVEAIAKGGAAAEPARRELARLGGAALPHVLPGLDALAPEPRARVASALGPLARRMELGAAAEAGDPARAVAFWTRFWDDRGVEFRRAAVRSAVRRLSRYGSDSRAADLYALDTFALEEVLGELEVPRDAADVEHARTLVAIAAHATDRDDVIPRGADVATAGACVERWRSFWSVYGADFVVLAGPSRLAAMVLEARYGKWALAAMTRRLGVDADGRPVLDVLARRAPITLALVFVAIGIGYSLAVLGAVIGAATRRREVDVALLALAIGLHALPTAVLGVLLAKLAGVGAAPLLTGSLALGLGLWAAPGAHARAALRSSLAREWVTAATARGSGRLRAVVVHALPSAVLPLVTLATLEAPVALGGAFVVERVLGLDGLGAATVHAVGARDVAFLMALALFAAGAAALGVVVADVASAVLDARLVPAVTARTRPR